MIRDDGEPARPFAPDNSPLVGVVIQAQLRREAAAASGVRRRRAGRLGLIAGALALVAGGIAVLVAAGLRGGP